RHHRQDVTRRLTAEQPRNDAPVSTKPRNHETTKTKSFSWFRAFVFSWPQTIEGAEMNRKVTVVGGAGNVGATVARGVADKQLAAVVVIDIADKKAAGVALDMLEACPVWGSDARVIGTGDYAESANSDIVVVTSGLPRKPGMSRDDLLNVNYKIMEQVTSQVVKYSPNCLIIVVSNPLDAMAQ